MIKKLNILKAIFVIALINSIVVLCVGQNAPGFNAFNENPTEVINIATQEIKKLKNISYNATYENIGAFSTSNSPAKGEIVLNNIKAKSHLDLNLWAKGFDIKEAKAEPFEVGYANKTMFRVRPSQKIITRKIISDTDVTEREFGFITGFFGRAFQKLTLFEIFQDNPFESLLNGKLLEYEGIALINDIPCHVIYAEFGESNSRTYKQRWYFGTKDYLPRRIEKITVNDTGKVGINTLTLSNLQTNTTVNPQLFSIKLPTGYSIKDYESPIEPPSLLTVGDFAHEWSLKDETGKTHSLSNYRGKVVVMDFWATWCGPCIKSMPEIENIHKKFEKRGVKVFGINSWEDGNAVAYFKDKKYSYGLLLNGETIDYLYTVPSLPTLYIIGINGEIIYSGNTPTIELVDFIEQYLKKNNM